MNRQTFFNIRTNTMNDINIPATDLAAPDSEESLKGSIRVSVGLLDTLMNLAGELVLSRNQLLQGVNKSNIKATGKSCQRIDLITSELQEAIMQTRMQPIDIILNKFRRIVRDRSQRLNKSIDLVIEGNDVELDRTIIESINEPLKHLVNMAVDHGIELPGKREHLGKKAAGTITLKAFHDAGQVNIILSDDGSGFDPARADGMDCVFSGIEQIGGNIEMNSTPDKGTDIQIKLPLTLAIIPSQITSVENERFAVPQVNLDELIRIPASDIKDRIEKVGDADVVRLRGELLPLLDLSKMLGIEKIYIDPETGSKFIDRRENISDRRSRLLLTDTDKASEKAEDQPVRHQRSAKDRRYSAKSALHIAVVSAGVYKYGLIVDQFHDSEEIVVKPVGRHLKKCRAYSGATIMGDGKASLILDISNLAQMAGLSTLSETRQLVKSIEKTSSLEKVAMITFKNSENEYFAALLDTVDRIERIQSSDIEQIGGKKVIQYRGGALPLFELSEVTDVNPVPQKNQQELIVFKVRGRKIGLKVSLPVDTLEIEPNIDVTTLKGTAVTGSIIINGHTTLLVDIYQMVRMLKPEWFR